MPEILTKFTSRLDFAGMQSFFAQAGGGNNPWGDLTFYKFTSGVIILLTIFWLCLQIYRWFQRTPALDKEFATKAELKSGLDGVRQAGETRRNEIMLEIEEQTRSLTAQLSHLESRTVRDMGGLIKSQQEQSSMLMAIQRSLGRLEGAAE